MVKTDLLLGVVGMLGEQDAWIQMSYVGSKINGKHENRYKELFKKSISRLIEGLFKEILILLGEIYVCGYVSSMS